MAILVISFLKGNEERQRLMRRNIIRYVLLSYCMATRWGGELLYFDHNSS